MTLTATPASGSNFVGFSSNCTLVTGHTDQCQITMSAAATVTATFQTTAPAADFTVAPAATFLSATEGGSASTTVTVTSLNNFAGTVALSATGLSTGSSAAFSPASVSVPLNGSATSTLTLNAGIGVPADYTVTITGTFGSTTRSASLTFRITGTVNGNAVELLTDDFVSYDTTKWDTIKEVPADSVDVVKGLMNLYPAASDPNSGIFVNSAAYWSLRDSSATVNALEVVSPAGSINCKFSFHAGAEREFSDVVGFWYEGGTLYAYYYVAGVQYSAGSVAYNRDTHAWWRLRHSGDTVYWETSRDRETWNVLGQVAESAIGFDLGNGVLGFDTKAYGTGNASPGSARFAYLNLPPVPTSGLTDAFRSIDPSRWYVSVGGTSSSATASGGVLSLSPMPNNGTAYVHVVGMKPYALTGSLFTVKVPQVVTGSHVNQLLRLAPGPYAWDDSVGFWLEGTNLYLYQQAYGSSTAIATLTYSSTTHRYWRVRESAGTVYWDTSSDGTTWTQRASAAVSGLSFSPALVTPFFTTDEWSTGATSPGSAQFSNLNAAP